MSFNSGSGLRCVHNLGLEFTVTKLNREGLKISLEFTRQLRLESFLLKRIKPLQECYEVCSGGYFSF